MKTIKVRIACVVTAAGNWNSTGWSTANEGELMGLAGEPMDDFPQAEYWLEAELPIPEQKTVAATVEKGLARG